ASSNATGRRRSPPPSVRSCDTARESAVVVDDDLAARRNRLAGEDPSLLDLVCPEGVVHAHRDPSLHQIGHAGPAVPRLAGERRIEARAPRGVENRIAGFVSEATLPAFEPD